MDSRVLAKGAVCANTGIHAELETTVVLVGTLHVVT